MNKTSNTIYVSSHFGRYIRCLLETCDGEALVDRDVSALAYSVEQVTFHGRKPVEGHTRVSISTDCISSDLKTSDNGETYNLEWYIDGTNNPPFPQAGGTTYAVILYVTLAADGKEYGNELEVVTL